MKENSARYFNNRDCAYYPCHEIKDGEEFNCLFCYCPLYAMGKECGGNFRYNGKGIKDCTECTLPHAGGGYEYVMERIRKVVDMGRQQ